jgi:hypothetical protein
VAAEEDAQAQEAKAAEARAPQAQVVATAIERSSFSAPSEQRVPAAFFFARDSLSITHFRCLVRGESVPSCRSFETHQRDFFVLLP